MNHLKEDELIAYFYGESSEPGECARHLAACGECAAAYEALTREIALAVAEIEAEPVPVRGAGYGEEVWRSLSPSLLPYASKHSGWRGWLGWLRQPEGSGSRAKLSWALASAAAVLVLVAFVAGRLWEHKFSPQPMVAQGHGGDAQTKPNAAPQTVQPVIVVLLSDHLERSERLLVELNHPDEAIVDPALQATARQLLAENRRYREAAAEGESAAAGIGSLGSSDDSGGKNHSVEISPAMTLTLDDLDRVLAQVAGQRDGLSRAEIAQVKQQINASGLLFEVRILRSRTHHSPSGATATRREGTV